MASSIAGPYSRGPLLRRVLAAGFLFFIAKGCAWLLAVALVSELL